MAELTNREIMERLSAKEKYEMKYSIKHHPLHNYIDWEAFMESTNRNEMEFINSVCTYENELGETIIVLSVYADEEYEVDYMETYNVETEIISCSPAPAPVLNIQRNMN